MKHLIAFILAFVGFAAVAFSPVDHGDPREAQIANMAAHCTCVMDLGVCAGYSEALATMPPSDYSRPRILGMLGIVQAGKWYEFNADPLMCERLARDCRLDFDGDFCRVARSQFDVNGRECQGAREPQTVEAPRSEQEAALLMFAGLLAVGASVFGFRRKE